MTQKLSDLIRFPCSGFRPIKTKAQVRREASRKAARTLKRQKLARQEPVQIDLEEAIAERAASETNRNAA